MGPARQSLRWDSTASCSPWRRRERHFASPAAADPTQLEVLRACIRSGAVAAAAYEIGVRETTARQHLSGLYRRIGCRNAAQAPYHLGVAEGIRPSRGVLDLALTASRPR